MRFREATSEDQIEIKKMKRYAFSGTRNRYDDPKDQDQSRDPYILKDYVAEESGILTAVIGVIDFSQRVRGTWVKMAGISGVACRAEYRRQNIMTELFQFVFKKIYEEGFLISSLYPFTYSFYEKLGYGQVDSIHIFCVKTSDIIQRPISNRIIREDFDPDYKRCQPLYAKLSSQTDGLVKRPSNVWKNLDGWNWTKDGFQFICQDQNGNDVGYLILRFERKSRDNPYPFIEVREMVFFDSDTKQAFLNFLANHESQREFIKFAPFDDNYLPFLKSPRIKENRVVPNSMLRIINVEQLLPMLKYPKGIKTSITIELNDPLTQCPWNNRIFTLNVADGTGILTTEKSKNKVLLDIKSFSQIVAGFYNPYELAEVKAITGSVEALENLAKIFPTQKFVLRDYF
ncbi:MAG: enhanced intracellular survival protein Eis [Candidatus Hodarchaeota archaeon]